MAGFNPNLQTSLKHELAQGSNVGDIREGYRWDGNTWTAERSSPSYSSSSSSSSSFNNSDFESSIQRSIDLMKNANKPAVDSLSASIPEIQQKYAQTRTELQGKQKPLEERYSNLLASIKGQGQQDINNQTRVTNNELGRRGIVGSSGVAEQEIQNATSPLMQKYAGLEKDTTLAREQGIQDLQNQISGLTPQETADTRAIQNAIAQLQSGAAQSGVSLGSDVYKTNLSNSIQQQQFQEQQRQAGIENAMRQAQLDNSSSQSSAEQAFRDRQFAESIRQFDVGQANRNAGNDTSGIAALLQQMNGGGVQGAAAKPSFSIAPASQRKLPQVGGGLR